VDVERDAALSAALFMLPVDRLPLTLSVADQLSNYGSDSHYAFALQALIVGVGVTAWPK